MELKNAAKLSQVAHKVLRSGTGRDYERLVVSDRGSPATLELLAAMSAADVLAGPALSQEDAAGLLAGLWLWHDFLDESHEISQGLHSVTGSFWHAILHRREGDFSNARYWYARCRNHPAYAQIGRRAATGTSASSENAGAEIARLTRDGWDPDAFVDLVARAHRHPADPATQSLVGLQKLEWTVLFEHCITAATARA